jgi:hypothetical protein
MLHQTSLLRTHASMQGFTFCQNLSAANTGMVVNRLPVRWEKTAILVMNEVRVSHPYLPDDVIGGPPAANERVRKVVNSCLSHARILLSIANF